MQRSTLTILAFWLLLASSLQAQLGLNPFEWFESEEDEELIALIAYLQRLGTDLYAGKTQAQSNN